MNLLPPEISIATPSCPPLETAGAKGPSLQASPSPKPRRRAAHSARANGKVARLPQSARDQINHWLQDGLPYALIIDRLGEDGKCLRPANISEWKKRGYQDWLIEQSFIERVQARQETPHKLVHDLDTTEVSHAALQLGALHLFEALRDLGPGSLDRKLGGDATSFFRLIHALARASRETMVLHKYREACAKARAALLPMQDPNRKLTESERRAIVRNVDDILGLPCLDDPDPETAQPPAPG